MSVTTNTTVLLVESDPAERERVARWLDEAGYEALMCSGPRAPTYRCLGGDGERCALAAGADAVVLDLWLASDTAMIGTPGWHLLAYYEGLGIPVVALVGDFDRLPAETGEGVVTVVRPVSRAALLDALRGALSTRRGRGHDLAG
jgi:CheY-like chemotaxis protein